MGGESLDMARLGQAIVAWRERLGWSTHRLAVRASLADPYLRKLEAGDGARVGIDVLIRIAAALGTTTDALLTDAGVPTAHGGRGEADAIYGQLDSVTRPAWLRMGHTLREIQEEYAQLQADDDALRVAEEPEDGEEDQPVPFTPPSGPKRRTQPPAEEVGIPEEDVAASQEPREEDGAGDAG